VPLHLAPLHALHSHGSSPTGTRASDVFAPQPPPTALRLPASTRSLPRDTANAHLHALNLPPEPGYAPYPASSATTPSPSRATVGNLRHKPPRNQHPQTTAIVPASTIANALQQQQPQPPASSSSTSTSSNVFQLTAMVPGESSGFGSTSSHLLATQAAPNSDHHNNNINDNDNVSTATEKRSRRRRRFGAAGALPPEELRGGFQDHQYHTYKLKLVASPLFEVASTSASWPKAGRRPDGSFRGGWAHPDFHPDTAMLKVMLPYMCICLHFCALLFYFPNAPL